MESLEQIFIQEAANEGLKGLKGHRSVGGIRASMYNACPMESVDALLAFMKDPWAAFDGFIISVSVVDNWILTPLGSSAGVSMLQVLRVFRLLRLIRLVKLLKLLKELWLLVSGMLPYAVCAMRGMSERFIHD